MPHRVPAEPVSVAARLESAVATRALEFDAAQRDAAAKLDRLSTRLAAPPPLARRLKSLFGSAPAHSASPPERGLYLWGGVGRGKTLLMDLFYRSLPFDQRERLHFYRFMQHVHAELRSIKNRSDPLDAVAARIAHRVRVLCLDEFFVADIADAMILAGLLEGLFKRGVTLVTTSNVAPQDLYKDGLQRQRFLPAIELIENHIDVVHLDSGVDYRLRQLEQAPTYLDSTQVDSATLMRGRFVALSGGVEPHPGVLRIENRDIAVLGTAEGVAWFEFSELCEGPRSQNDYIEIARLYHTVFVSHIPRFTRMNENAARRFIMLIDEFYDRGVNIVVSAAEAPAALYHGERLQFEFERAASRLIEMQTQSYLAGQHRP